MADRARHPSPIVASCYALGAIGLAYLLYKCWSLYGDPGFDFKYLWIAGELWSQGITPDNAAFSALAARQVTDGMAPEVWSYPPSWWVICMGLAQLSLAKAHLAWNLASIALIAGASLLLAKSVRPAFGEVRTGSAAIDAIVQRPVPLACLHFFLMAGFEPTATLISVGQTTAPIYFGAAALLYGLASGKRGFAIAGLALTFLKPQIGVVFAAIMLFRDKQSRELLLAAVAVSAALAAPAVVADPAIIGVFLGNAAGHEGIMPANQPGGMTGLRHLSGLSGHPMSTLWALAATVAAALAACAVAARASPGESTQVRAWQTMILTTAVITAFAPLHFYDLILTGVTLFALGAGSWASRGAGLAGLLLMLRADELGTFTGLYDHTVRIFEGSLLSTLGALMMLVAAWGAALRWERSRGMAAWPVADVL